MSAYVALRSDTVTVTCAPAVECRLGVVRRCSVSFRLWTRAARDIGGALRGGALPSSSHVGLRSRILTKKTLLLKREACQVTKEVDLRD